VAVADGQIDTEAIPCIAVWATEMGLPAGNREDYRLIRRSRSTHSCTVRAHHDDSSIRPESGLILPKRGARDIFKELAHVRLTLPQTLSYQSENSECYSLWCFSIEGQVCLDYEARAGILVQH
jgi:hypothetical protein